MKILALFLTLAFASVPNLGDDNAIVFISPGSSTFAEINTNPFGD